LAFGGTAILSVSLILLIKLWFLIPLYFLGKWGWRVIQALRNDYPTTSYQSGSNMDLGSIFSRARAWSPSASPFSSFGSSPFSPLAPLAFVFKFFPLPFRSFLSSISTLIQLNSTFQAILLEKIGYDIESFLNTLDCMDGVEEFELEMESIQLDLGESFGSMGANYTRSGSRINSQPGNTGQGISVWRVSDGNGSRIGQLEVQFHLILPSNGIQNAKSMEKMLENCEIVVETMEMKGRNGGGGRSNGSGSGPGDSNGQSRGSSAKKSGTNSSGSETVIDADYQVLNEQKQGKGTKKFF
jgi:hypothetical protein